MDQRGLRVKRAVDILDGVSSAARSIEPRVRKLRIARNVARKCIDRGLWTEGEAEEFLEGVREKVCQS